STSESELKCSVKLSRNGSGGGVAELARVAGEAWRVKRPRIIGEGSMMRDDITCGDGIPWSTFEPNLSERGKVIDITPGPSSIMTVQHWCDEMLFPSEEVAKRALLDGLESSQIRVFGLPIRPSFCCAIISKEMKIKELETNHFVLVHGGGFGAWCWYKTITHLEEGGFKVDAIDLTGSGVHSCDTNSITSLTEYVKPLTNFLKKLGEGKKVHSDFS
ncbi:hypothetical protein IFM89_030682, partial [Coptis chinensis]